ncbi:hypothetical protein [Anaerosolibacter carboniphilus]|nr:hypothetical protein [Anaerosolibacter carboniphilus]
MEKYTEVMRNAVDLSDTIHEALQYINEQLEIGNHSEVLGLLKDTSDAVIAIENSIIPILKQFSTEIILKGIDEFKVVLEQMEILYQGNNLTALKEVLSIKGIPLYIQWRSEMYKAFYPYIVS